MDPRYRYQSQIPPPQYYDNNSGNYWNNNYASQPPPTVNYNQSAYNPWTYPSNQCAYQPQRMSYATSNYDLPPLTSGRATSAMGLTEVLSSYKHGPTVIMMEKKKGGGWRKHKLWWGSIFSLTLILSLLWTYGYINMNDTYLGDLSNKITFSPLETLEGLKRSVKLSSSPPQPEVIQAESHHDYIPEVKENSIHKNNDNNSGPGLPEMNSIPKKTKVIWSFDEDDDDEVFIEDIFTHTVL